MLESCNGYSETKGVLKYLNYCLDCGAYPERIDISSDKIRVSCSAIGNQSGPTVKFPTTSG